MLMGAHQLLLRTVRFARRSPRELLLLARMAGWVVALSVLIKLLPLPRAIGLVATTPRRVGLHHALPAARLAQLIDLLLGINLLVFTPTCWKRAPVLQRYLALYGMETRIIFGVRKTDDDTLAGHAWLEADGQPVFETKPPEYIVTYAYP